MTVLLGRPHRLMWPPQICDVPGGALRASGTRLAPTGSEQRPSSGNAAR